MHALVYSERDTPVGRLRAEATERGLARLHFVLDGDDGPTPGAARDDAALAPVWRALDEYLAGARRDFADVPLDVREGTEFDRAVWRELARIPYGRTITYADLARAVGNPNAFRAVGRANGRNPVAVIVPCHRVVASNGLGGYAGSLAVKRRLLDMERARATGQATLAATSALPP